MRSEIESLAAFDAHLATGASLRGCAVVDVTLIRRARLLADVDVQDALFLGCRMSHATADSLSRRGAAVFPRLPDVPFDAYRTLLYTPEELYRGLENGYGATRDGAIYAWTRRADSQLLDGTLARALHDHSISDALGEVAFEAQSGVGIMGGHATHRGHPDYVATAALAWRLARSGKTVLTGGGPGIMEAANLGASCRGDEATLQAACRELARVPGFAGDVEAWAQTALHVRAAFDCTGFSLGIPTWFYGHEPPNAFAARIAKYFDNAIREDVLLRMCGGGIVFTPGAAGTVQEIFQATTRGYYATDEQPVPPLVLVGRDYWTSALPAWPLLTSLARGRRLQDRVHLVDTVADALDALT